jgi:hypothetical protein
VERNGTENSVKLDGIVEGKNKFARKGDKFMLRKDMSEEGEQFIAKFQLCVDGRI